MGQETVCVARFGESVSKGKVLLESEDLRFRGAFRLTIPFGKMHSVAATGGELAVDFEGGRAIFELGDLAERWAEKIRNPRRLIDKLDVKPDARVAIVGVDDDSFLNQLRGRTRDVLRYSLVPGLDLIFLQAETVARLEQIDALVPFLRRDGALWVIAPKGQRQITELDVLSAGRAAGLTDVKVARFSATHTAHKFVVPKARR